VQPQKKLAEDDTLNNKGADDSTKQAAATYSSSRYWVIGTLVSAVALGVIIATSGVTFRNVCRPVPAMVRLRAEQPH